MERDSAAGGGSEVDVEEDERRQSLRVWEEKVLRDRPVPVQILKSQFSSGFLSFKCTRTLTFLEFLPGAGARACAGQVGRGAREHGAGYLPAGAALV